MSYTEKLIIKMRMFKIIPYCFKLYFFFGRIIYKQTKMSLNKLSLDVERGRDIQLRIGCAELKVNEITFDGVDGDAGDALISDGNGNISVGEIPPPVSVSTFGMIRNTNTGTGPFPVPIGGGNMYLASDTSVVNETILPPAYYALAPNGLQILQSGKYKITLAYHYFVNSPIILYSRVQLSVNGDLSISQPATTSSHYHNGTVPIGEQDFHSASMTDILSVNAGDVIGWGVFQNSQVAVTISNDSWFLTAERMGDL